MRKIEVQKIGENILKGIYDFSERKIEENTTAGKILSEIIPLAYIISKSKSPKKIQENLMSYFETRKILNTQKSILELVCLGTAIELGIVERISGEKKTADEISSEIGTEKMRTETLLDALCYFGFAKKEGSKYQLEPKFKRTLEKSGDYLKFMWSQFKAFAELPIILKNGKPSEILNIYNLEGDYATLLYNVNSFLYIATRELMRKFEFKNIRKIMIGSMGISFAKNIQKKFPEVEVHIGCYPHLIERVPELVKKYGLINIKTMKPHKGIPSEDRWGEEEGGYDLVFLTKKLTLKELGEFGDEFLKKTYKVLRKGGYGVIWEAIVSDEGTSGPIEESLLDLLVSFSGKRWKESEMREYVISRGFSDFKIVKCLGGKATFGVAIK
ncbi:hypothetical protein HRbin19_00282 [bacterium HR19]|nr:hypothetical protein HRbin19_00282 [bacterium HR19]